MSIDSRVDGFEDVARSHYSSSSPISTPEPLALESTTSREQSYFHFWKQRGSNYATIISLATTHFHNLVMLNDLFPSPNVAEKLAIKAFKQAFGEKPSIVFSIEPAMIKAVRV